MDSYEAEEEQIDFEEGVDRIFDPYYAIDLGNKNHLRSFVGTVNCKNVSCELIHPKGLANFLGTKFFLFCCSEDIAYIDGKRDKQGYPLNRADVTTNSGDNLIGIWKNGTR